jgi:hypothetical protein
MAMSSREAAIVVVLTLEWNFTECCGTVRAVLYFTGMNVSNIDLSNGTTTKSNYGPFAPGRKIPHANADLFFFDGEN